LESYLCFTVESLCFSVFAIRSPFVYLSLPCLCFSSAARRHRCPARCAALPPLRRSGSYHVLPRPLPCSFPPRAGISPLGHVVRLLPEPIPAAARRRSVCRATSCLQTPHASCLSCAAAFPALCWPARVPPRCGAFARALPRLPHTPSMRQLLPPLGHVLFLNPSTSWSL
jgi:hypothetical protein